MALVFNCSRKIQKKRGFGSISIPPLKNVPPEVHEKIFIIIGFGSSFGNGKTLPCGTFPHLAYQYNLTDVVGVVHHLFIQRFYQRVALVAD